MEENKTKRCPKCGRELPTTMFNKKTQSKDGLQPYCKECQRSYYSKKNAEKSVTEHKVSPVAVTSATRPLEGFHARELFAELRFRGYKGKIYYTKTVEL